MVNDYNLQAIKALSADKLEYHNPYVSYTHTYPHIICYRKFPVPLSLNEMWNFENKSHLFLYLHIPFCKQQCGYCSAFCKIGRDIDLVDPYISAMEIQAKIINNMFQSLRKSFHFDQITVGGGSPSLLNVTQMKRVLDIIEDIFQIPISSSDLSIQLHPNSSEDLLDLLSERYINRISVEVQSFLDKDLKRLHQSTSLEHIHNTLELITSIGFTYLNIDLIYGIRDQTEDDVLQSLENAIQYEPDEICFSPLYLRPKTALGENYESTNWEKLQLYNIGRQRLLDAGFYQDSMRRFVKKSDMLTKTSVKSHSYDYLRDGTVGVGCGALSYTKNVHYSEPYAISQPEIHRIILKYIDKSPASFLYASHGIQLSEEDRKRRFILKSLMNKKGLDMLSYRQEFKNEPLKEFHELDELLETDLVQKNGNFLALSEKGLAYSDVIGPWLYSQTVVGLIIDTDLE